MESLPFSRKALVLSFLWQSADARVDARCCKLGHVQLLLSAVMEKGSGYMGQVSGGQSDRAAGKKGLQPAELHFPKHPNGQWLLGLRHLNI